MMRLAFKYRLYPNVDQTRELAIALETHRRIYNACIEQRKTAWETENRSVTFGEQRKWFSAQQHVGHPFYSRLNNNSANDTIQRVDRAFQAFFRRVKAKSGKAGYPRFRSRDRYDSMSFCTYPNGAKLIGAKLRVHQVGTIKIKLHRPVEGTIKTLTIKREADKWYVVFSCDLGDVAVEPSTNPPIGIDVGLESFLTTSDGEQVPNPRYLKSALPDLRRKGRAVSRKKRGGKNRRKAVKQLANAHAKVRDARKEHHNQTALNLVRRYGLIAAESLNIQGMLRSGRFSRAISDVAWGNFLLTLKSQAEKAGVSYVEVDARGTSQLCSGCRAEVRKDLKVRHHDCPHCGLSLHRDENAARNILARGLPARIEPAAVNVGHQVVRPPRSPFPVKTCV